MLVCDREYNYLRHYLKKRLSDFFLRSDSHLWLSGVYSGKDVVFNDGDINRFWSFLIH